MSEQIYEEMLEILEQKCGPLTHNQKVMIKAKQANVIGYARPLGRGEGVWAPAVMLGNTVNVFDRAGHYQLAASLSVHCFMWGEE